MSIRATSSPERLNTKTSPSRRCESAESLTTEPSRFVRRYSFDTTHLAPLATHRNK